MTISHGGYLYGQNLKWAMKTYDRCRWETQQALAATTGPLSLMDIEGSFILHSFGVCAASTSFLLELLETVVVKIFFPGKSQQVPCKSKDIATMRIFCPGSEFPSTNGRPDNQLYPRSYDMYISLISPNRCIHKHSHRIYQRLARRMRLRAARHSSKR